MNRIKRIQNSIRQSVYQDPEGWLVAMIIISAVIGGVIMGIGRALHWFGQ